MLTVIRGEFGQLHAACEWWTVNEAGLRDPHGRYVWVEQLELPTVHPDDTVPAVIRDIAGRAPQAIGAYWVRRDKTGGQLHAFRRTRLLREQPCTS